MVPLGVASWGPFILLNLESEHFPHQQSLDNVGTEWLGSASEILSVNGVDSSLSYLCRREYIIECNWKVKFSFFSLFLLTVMYVPRDFML